MGGVSPKEWMMEKPYLIDQGRCTGCQICARECPTNAISVELDPTKPLSARPKPVILRKERIIDDGRWHPLSEYTKEYLKRPITSMWSGLADWKPMTQSPAPSQVWRGMKKPKEPEPPQDQVVLREEQTTSSQD